MEYSICPICKSDKTFKLQKYKKHFYAKCLKCSFIFAYRIPTETELNNTYNPNYGMHTYFSPITRKRYNELLKEFEKFRKTGKILDYGCGKGLFLEEAINNGWKAYGTEYNEITQKKCIEKGIKIIGHQEISIVLKNEFDIICCMEVIEHLYNPLELTNKLSFYLRHGGLLYITTPNFNCISRRIQTNKWTVLAYPEHLSMFTSRTLKALLQANGFRILKLKTHGFSLSHFKHSLSNCRPTSIHKYNEDEKIRELTEEKTFYNTLKKMINGLLSWTSTGDTIKCLAIKR